MIKHRTPLLQRIYTIEDSTPGFTIQTWFDVQPTAKFTLARKRWVLTQPSSTFWVYALGLLTCCVGVHFAIEANGDTARQLWALGLWLWGIGALLAGTSYQGFGYHLKCRGDYIAWTNWWEAVYMICQQLSINVLLVAAATTSAEGMLREGLIVVALCLSVVFTVLVFIGAFLPNRRLLSFEWMMWVSTPPVLIMLLLHSINFVMADSTPEGFLALIWLGLIVCMLAYGVYLKGGYTQKLWQQKIWFSENDVLHITLIIWIIYVAWCLPFIQQSP